MAATCQQLAGKLEALNRTTVVRIQINDGEVKGILNDVTRLGTPVRQDVAHGVADVKGEAQKLLDCLDQRQRPVSNVFAKEETGKGGKQDGEIATTLSIRSRQAGTGTGTRKNSTMYTFTAAGTAGDAVSAPLPQSFNFTIGSSQSLQVSLTVRILTFARKLSFQRDA